ncbi:hypothetical protein [Variovorax sp. KK3]|uniref:DUF6959 family protein n=1 Tax=Variovorax sp. KK3 TaxID=1855728 RepID=UPI00097C4DA9|nr:hypothetical protein [Variovorax sp. KK3]
MKSIEIKLLSPPENFAVVQLPERQYPGVVIQGDTLAALVSQLGTMREHLHINDLERLADELDELEEKYVEAKEHYESACATHGISLPYSK